VYVEGDLDPAIAQECAELVGEIPGEPRLATSLRNLHDHVLAIPTVEAHSESGDVSEHITSEHHAQRFLWVGLFQPTKAELQAVGEVFNLDPEQLHDAANTHQRAKTDLQGPYGYVVLKVLDYIEATSAVETGQIAIFIGPSYIVTVRFGSVGNLQDVRQRVDSDEALQAAGSIGVLLAIMERVVDEYGLIAEEIEKDIEELEVALFSPHVGVDRSSKIYLLKRENLELRRAVQPLVPRAHEMARGRFYGTPKGFKGMFRNIGETLLRTAETAEANDQLLMSLLMATNSQMDRQQNTDVRRLAAWAAILAVPTAIAGIYGMNFVDMPGLESKVGFEFIMALMIGICVALYVGFKRSDWL